MRPSKIKNYMDLAETVAARSPDEETKVGVLLINNKTGAILATGYNGFVRGADDEHLPRTRPLKYEYMIHGEMNLLINCAKHGISTEDCYLVSTMTPCKLCMRLMVNAGITGVVAKEKYRDFEEILHMQDVSVEWQVGDEGFYEIKYCPRPG